MWETGMLILVFVYVLTMYLITRSAYVLFSRNRWVTRNYLGMRVVHSFGLLISIHYVCFAFFLFVADIILDSSLFLSNKQTLLGHLPVFIMGLSIITITGWVDDRFGITEVKGIRGHLHAFLVEHQLTSGFLKAVLGSLVALVGMYLYSETIFQWLLYSSLVISSIHVFNLLDVRPGRAIKSYWFLSLLLIPFSTLDHLAVFFFPAIVATLLIFPYERKCLTMLGDAGSNVLGFIFGYYIVMLNDLLIQIFMLCCFVLLSVLAEKISFSEYIQKTPWLSKLDNWGIQRYSIRD